MHDGIEIITYTDGLKKFKCNGDVAVYIVSLSQIFCIRSIRIINDFNNDDEDSVNIFDLTRLDISKDIYDALVNKTLSYFVLYSDGLISLHVNG